MNFTEYTADTKLFNVCFIKNQTKYNSKTLLSLVRIFMKQTLGPSWTIGTLPRFDLVLKNERLHCASVLENNGMSDLSPHFKPRFSRVKNSFANCSLSSRVTSYLTQTFFLWFIFQVWELLPSIAWPSIRDKNHIRLLAVATSFVPNKE